VGRGGWAAQPFEHVVLNYVNTRIGHQLLACAASTALNGSALSTERDGAMGLPAARSREV
jgi:hypothetical protein